MSDKQRPTILRAVLVAALSCAVAPPVHAQADGVRAEAAERFDRGLRLFDERNLPAALAELERANALLPNPIVLLNVGLVQAAMGRSVDAVATLDRVLAAPGTLSAARIEQATKTRDEQARRIGEIGVTANVAGATIELDGVVVGKAPLAAPLRVASGEHVISVIATGYAPARKSISVAGKARSDVSFDLVEMQGKIAWLAVRASTPAIEVRVDGELSGRTPLPAPLAVAPGKRAIELRRPGYRVRRHELAVAEGTTAEIDGALEEDASAPRARLSFTASEPDAQLTIDGVPRGAVTSLDLPLGVHRVRAERAGFLAVERDVDLSPAGEMLRVTFEPTPETRAAYVGRARSRRTLGVAATATGAALIAGGAVYLLVNASATREKRATFFEISDQFDAGGRCDKLVGKNSAACYAELDAAKSDYDASRGRRVYGWVGVGVGAAAAGVGVFLLATGDDPKKYDRPPVTVAPLWSPDVKGAALTAQF